MWHINAHDISGLQGQDERFTEFVDSLLRAEMFLASVPDSGIRTNLRTTTPDGGVDTQLTVPVPGTRGGWCETPTCWQYKARGYRGVLAKERKDDPGKSYAASLISAGYGYRLCLADDMPASKKTEWEKGLSQAVVRLNRSAPPPMVVTAGDLAAWASRYPAVVARFFRPPRVWRLSPC